MGNYIDWQFNIASSSFDHSPRNYMAQVERVIIDLTDDVRHILTVGYQMSVTQITGHPIHETIDRLKSITDEYVNIVVKYYDSNNGIEGFFILHNGKVIVNSSWQLEFDEESGFPIETVFGLYPSTTG